MTRQATWGILKDGLPSQKRDRFAPATATFYAGTDNGLVRIQENTILHGSSHQAVLLLLFTL